MNEHEIVQQMKIHGQDNSIQLLQTKHRIHLINEANITEGMRVLEIGCGQGDTTAVIAAKVGATGYVKAIDLAEGSYGSPITLEEATTHLKNGELGQQIDFQLQTDLLQLEIDEHFDVAIFSLCTWYLESFEVLEKLIKKAATVADYIVIADWDIVAVDIHQTAHQQAALIQALYATQYPSEANIRNVFTRQQIELALINCGSVIEKNTTINASDLHDGQWEVDYALTLNFDASLTPLVNTLKEMIALKKTEQYSMNNFLIRAKNNA